MLLSYNELCKLVEQNVIEGVDLKDVNAASIDVHLGGEVLVERYNDHSLNIVDPFKRTNFDAAKFNLIGGTYDLMPNEFVLASTREKFNLPDDIVAEFKLKSSGARSGLDNALATWCDAGWHGSALTLELRNNLRYHRIRLTEGMPIGQMIFYRVAPVPRDRSYATIGRYNNDSSVQAVKL
jgi:dCTP deaminase